MDIENIYTELEKILTTSKILKNEDMSKYTSFKIGGKVDILVKANCIEDIKSVLDISKENNLPLYVIGNGSNLLVKDAGIRGIVLMISMDDILVEKEGNNAIVTVDSGVKLAKLAYELLNESIEGFEFASGIPGTIGGAVRMNAGAHGKEFKDIVLSTTYMDYNGNIHTVSNVEQKFEYRNSMFANMKCIILSTKLKLTYGNKEEINSKMQEYANYRKEKQPINYPSAGSTFKRGEDFITAKLIDECGLKGYSIGGAQVSDLHAGFIINKGNATAKDVLDLVEYVKEKVYQKFSKKIALEIEVIGE